MTDLIKAIWNEAELKYYCHIHNKPLRFNAFDTNPKTCLKRYVCDDCENDANEDPIGYSLYDRDTTD